MKDDCFVCRKHRREIEPPGGAIHEDDSLFISHGFTLDQQVAHYLGHILVEPKRHIPGLDDLTDEEAQQIGLYTTRLGRALKEIVQAEHIYLFVLGHHVDHLHLHLFPRYPGAPREYWGLRVDEWPDAPKGNATDIGKLCDQLRAYLQQSF